MGEIATIILMVIAWHFVIECDSWLNKNRNHFGDK